MVDLLVFPFRARTALVHSLVDDLQKVHGEAANSFWRRRISELVAEMRRTGMTDASVRAEILELQHAVQNELVARSRSSAFG